MEKPRFSIKELLKTVPIKSVIPSDYRELKNASLVHETEKAYLIDFILETECYQSWFPKQFVIIDKKKYYASDWIIKQKITK